MTSRRFQILLFGILVSSALAAQELKTCSSSPRFCDQQIRQMLGGRRYLGLQIVDVRPGFLLVKGVVPESPASRVDFRNGDRIISINNQRMTEDQTVKNFKQVLSQASNTGTLWVIVSRRGNYMKIDVRLEPYSQDQLDKIVKQHLAQSHATTSASAGNPK